MLRTMKTAEPAMTTHTSTASSTSGFIPAFSHGCATRRGDLEKFAAR